MASPARDYQAIHRIADQLTPALRRRFLEAVARLQGRVSFAEIERALRLGGLTIALTELLNSFPRELRPAVRVMNDAFAKAGAVTANRGGLRLASSFALTNPLAVTAADQRSALLVREVTNETRRALQQIITRSIQEGIPPRAAARLIKPLIGLTQKQADAVFTRWLQKGDAAAERYAQQLLRHRAQTIARTETIRSSVDGQLAIWRNAQRQGLLPGTARKHWLTVPDDRLCFAAGTSITTPFGEMPIELVREGDLVLTHLGARRVKSTIARPTRSQIVQVVTASGATRATADHPYLVLRNGWPEWCLAGNLEQGDLLCEVKSATHSNGSAKGFHITLGDPNDTPSMLPEVCSLSGVPVFVPVPVRAIHFESDATSAQQEIDTVAADSCFLGEAYPQPLQLQTDGLFESVLSAVPAVAGHRTIQATTRLLHLGWDNPESLSTVSTTDDDGRASAFFGAPFSSATLVGETRPATLAELVRRFSPSTLERAHGVTVSNYHWYRERLLADSAFLRDAFGSACNFVADTAAETTSLEAMSSRRPELFPAMFASEGVSVDPTGSMVALAGAVPVVGAGDGLTASDAGSHNDAIVPASIVVYSLEVEDARTFFAGGALVHNCPICAPLQGEEVPLDAPFSIGVLGPPAHPNCRCAVSITAISRRAAA